MLVFRRFVRQPAALIGALFLLLLTLLAIAAPWLTSSSPWEMNSPPMLAPLHAVGIALGILQVGGEVPPFDAIAVMGAMVLGKAEDLAGHHLGKVRGLAAQPGEAFFRRRRFVAGAQQQEGRP